MFILLTVFFLETQWPNWKRRWHEKSYSTL